LAIILFVTGLANEICSRWVAISGLILKTQEGTTFQVSRPLASSYTRVSAVALFSAMDIRVSSFLLDLIRSRQDHRVIILKDFKG
jgi:hypothetical protein